MIRTLILRIAGAATLAGLVSLYAAPITLAQTPPSTAPATPTQASPPAATPRTETPAPAPAPAQQTEKSPPAAAPGTEGATPKGDPSQQATPAPEQNGDPNAAPDTATVTPIELPQRPALIVRNKVKWDDGYKAITEAFTKLRAEVDRAKLKTDGHPLAVFVESDDDGFTFEAMMPLEAEPPADFKPGEGIKTGKNPGGKALKFEHRGSYDEIESTYEAIAAYLDEKGLAARDELIEEFVKETVGSDDQELQVDIYVLLKE